MGQRIQLHRPFPVLFHAVAVFIAFAQQEFRPVVALGGGFCKPLRRLDVVLLHGDAQVVEKA